jgi:hypothetical protein
MKKEMITSICCIIMRKKAHINMMHDVENVLDIYVLRSDENALHRVGMHVCGMANMDTSAQVRALAQRLAQLIFDVDS